MDKEVTMPNYQLQTSICYIENSCTYQLQPETLDVDEEYAVRSFKNVLELYEKQLNSPEYNEEELTVTVSLFKIFDGYDIPILMGCYEIKKYPFILLTKSGFLKESKK